MKEQKKQRFVTCRRHRPFIFHRLINALVYTHSSFYGLRTKMPINEKEEKIECVFSKRKRKNMRNDTE